MEINHHFWISDNKTRWLALLGAILLVSFLGACTPDPNDLFIQGGWYYNDQHILEAVGESFSETYWTFDRGNYETFTCCFVKFEQFGRYDVLKSEGDVLTLEFFNTNGKFNSERFQVAIHIDRETDTIKVQGGGTFIRNMP